MMRPDIQDGLERLREMARAVHYLERAGGPPARECIESFFQKMMEESPIDPVHCPMEKFEKLVEACRQVIMAELRELESGSSRRH